MSAPAKDRKPFSIGHVARVTGVSVSTLRSWETQGLIEPQKSEGGHRLFSMEDIERVRTIERLRRVSGYGIGAIRRTLQEQDQPAQESPAARPADTEAWADFNRIGGRIRALRKAAQMSLRDLSERTEIGTSHLSMFERGQAFLSPARLSAIGAVFGTSLAELIGGTRGGDTPIVRKGKGRLVGSFGPGVTIEQLTVAQRLMDAEIWTVEPGRESDGFYSHEGEELIYVLDGSFEITIAGRDPEVLTSGDCAYFSSSIDHRWRNTGTVPAVVLWINTDSSRLSTMRLEKSDRRIGLGARVGEGIGSGSLSIELSDSTETFRVIETHTGGHPTRILIEPLDGLDAPTAAGKAEQIRDRYDHIRKILLQEPRGHTGSFGLVPVASEIADFGAVFIASYGYPAMCGHAVLGFAKTLKALGRLKGRTRFTVEVPAGVLNVSLAREGAVETIGVDIEAHRPGPAVALTLGNQTLAVRPCFAGHQYGVVDAEALGIALVPANIEALLQTADAVKAAWSDRADARAPALEAVLFCERPAAGPARQFVAIGGRKFDRSPGVTALAARLTVAAADGDLAPGAPMEVQSIFGGCFRGALRPSTDLSDGAPVWTAHVDGQAHLYGISTLVLEEDDPLGSGFLR